MGTAAKNRKKKKRKIPQSVGFAIETAV